MKNKATNAPNIYCAKRTNFTNAKLSKI